MRIIFFILGLLSPLLAIAASSDKDQNAFIVADSTTLNYKTHTGIYRGHVKMTQGTTTLLADEVITYGNKHNKLIRAIATGQPARYSTLPDHSHLLFTAIGETIDYYPLQGRVELIGQAQAKQGNDSLAGPHITYNINQQTVVSLFQKTQRTTIVIQPDQKLSQ